MVGHPQGGGKGPATVHQRVLCADHEQRWRLAVQVTAERADGRVGPLSVAVVRAAGKTEKCRVKHDPGDGQSLEQPLLLEAHVQGRDERERDIRHRAASVSPPGQRKARDLNPHDLAVARFSKPARQTISGYPPKQVTNELRHSSCGGRIRTGVERLMRPCWEPGSSPLRSTPGRTRTCADCLFVREVPSPLGHGGNVQSGRQESNLPSTAYQTVASPLGFGPNQRPVRESNPSRLFDRQAGTPAPSQGKYSAWRESNPPVHLGTVVPGPLGHRRDSKGGRSRTLCVRVGAAWLSQEHALVSAAASAGLEPATNPFRAGRSTD